MNDLELIEDFDHWWEIKGFAIDPDTEEVSWFDKRFDTARIAFIAGYDKALERMNKVFWHHVSEKPASRGCYLCRMKEDEGIVYKDLKYDDGWYGQGYRSITHWAEIPMLLWKE